MKEIQARMKDFYQKEDQSTQRTSAGSIDGFVQAKCELNPYLFVIPAGLYSDYQEFCQELDLDKMAFTEFENEIFDLYDIKLSSFLSEGKMIKIWRGIGWDMGVEVEDDGIEAIQERSGSDFRIPYPKLRTELDNKIPGWQNMPESQLGYLYDTSLKRKYHHLYQPIGKLLGLYTFRSWGVN